MATTSWRDRLSDWRNRFVADPAFQRWAAAFPLSRPVARAKARDLFDLQAGFIYSQITLAFVQLDLPSRLAAGPMDTPAVAEMGAMPVASAERLLRAAAVLGLAERRSDGRWGLGERGAALLGAPGVIAMIRHHPLLYADLADPLAVLRRGGGGGQLSAYWPYAEDRAADPEAVTPYSELMAASQAMVATQVLDAYPVGRHRRLMDVGGGAGAFVRAAAERVPDLELALFDLPAVADRTRAAFAAESRGGVEVTGGSFTQNALPRGADLISLIRILHDHEDDTVGVLLRAVRDALPPGGRLLIGEPLAEARGAERVGDAYFGMYLLAMGSGRARTASEIRKMLAQAGFARSWTVQTAMPLVAGVVVAEA
jgi:demethylspheroidene O-methyltransferase